MLKGYGFPPKFCELIMLYVTTPQFSIKVNGECHDYFKGRRGLRQDDLMIFWKGHVQSFSRIMEALQHFLKTTGLVANIDKSNMFVAGVDAPSKVSLLQLTGYVVGTFPIRYLGLSLSPKKWNKLDCYQLCKRIIKKLRVVSTRHLSYAEKLQVINSVIFSLHNFWGSVFILPQSVLKEVDKRCREFLWGTIEENKRIPLVAWE